MDSFRSLFCHGFKCSERLSSCKKHAEHDWASLPLLPLWMIKDKLDIFDNFSLSSVCRDWHSMSSSYPKRQTIGDGMPWIMQLKRSILSGARDFVSVSRKKKFTLDLPVFVNALLLHSKQGWLLMLRKNLTKERKSYPDPELLFLINPFTRAKIELPDVVLAYATQECHGSFSTRNGYPERVVLLTGCFSGQMTLFIAIPGDLSWTKHSFSGQPMQIDGRCGLLTVEEKVYYLNLKENMIIYDVGTKEWKELPGLGNESGDSYIMEYGEKIINLFFSTSEHTSHSFYSYNDTEFTWERINIDFMKETSWYLSTETSCFSAKDRDSKVNQLVPKYHGLYRGAPMTYGYDIVSHDFFNGVRQSLEFPWQINSSAEWVDIG